MIKYYELTDDDAYFISGALAPCEMEGSPQKYFRIETIPVVNNANIYVVRRLSASGHWTETCIKREIIITKGKEIKESDLVLEML